MSHDQTFRAGLIVAFLLVLPIGTYHRLTSQATREKLDRRQEGLFILATLRPVGIVVTNCGRICLGRSIAECAAHNRN